jgi:hypothetical protein
MSIMSQADLADLQSEFEGLKGSHLKGLLIGCGSIVLVFPKATILVQCSFEVKDGQRLKEGDGESCDTSVLLIPFLNKHVTYTSVSIRGEAILEFETGHSIKIIPDDTGFEAYVLSTPAGVSPVW